MEFMVTEPGLIHEMLLLTSAITAAEAYSVQNEIMDVRLTFDNSMSSAEFALYQNQPNPWDGETMIGFDLPRDAAATLTVYDVTGKLLKTVSGQYKEGYNVIRLFTKELPGPGVFYYRLESGGYSASKKMMIIR